jgi:hypothetical protein
MLGRCRRLKCIATCCRALYVTNATVMLVIVTIQSCFLCMFVFLYRRQVRKPQHSARDIGRDRPTCARIRSLSPPGVRDLVTVAYMENHATTSLSLESSS